MMQPADIGRKVLSHVISPDQFDFWANELGSIAAWERCFARVVAIHRDQHSITLGLKPNRHWSGYRAGQHCNLTVEIEGRNVTRSYSLSSAPGSGHLEITVCRETGGLVSNWLFDYCKVGQKLELGAAFGDGVIPPISKDQELPRGLLLLAAGSGITPIMSTVRALLANAIPIEVTVLYWARGADQWLFRQELQQMQSQYKNLVVHFIATGDEQSDGDSGGRINAAQLESLASGRSYEQIFACGGAGFVDAAERLFDKGAIEFRSESFTPRARLSSNAASGVQRVELRKSGLSLDLPAGKSLLEALEDAGIAVQYGCRQGNCNTCSCVKASGITQDIYSGVEHREPLQRIKLCSSRATSELTLEL